MKPSLLFRLRRRLTRYIPLRVYHYLLPRDVIGLCYHLVADECPPHVKHLGAFKSTEMFEADLQYLKANFEVISYEDACDQTFESSSEPRRGNKPKILLTFDDGYQECFSVVRPLLLKYNLPAIFFITTSFIDNRELFYRNKISLCIEALNSSPSGTCHLLPDTLESLTYEDLPKIDKACEELSVDCSCFLTTHRPYLTTKQIRQLDADGFTIGAHGFTHRRLTSPLTPDNCHLLPLSSELTESVAHVAELTSASSVPFAFPFSADNISREVLSALRQANPNIGLLFDRRGFEKDEPFMVQRVVADSFLDNGVRSDIPQKLHRACQMEFRNG